MIGQRVKGDENRIAQLCQCVVGGHLGNAPDLFLAAPIGDPEGVDLRNEFPLKVIVKLCRADAVRFRVFPASMGWASR